MSHALSLFSSGKCVFANELFFYSFLTSCLVNADLLGAASGGCAPVVGGGFLGLDGGVLGISVLELLDSKRGLHAHRGGVAGAFLGGGELGEADALGNLDSLKVGSVLGVVVAFNSFSGVNLSLGESAIGGIGFTFLSGPVSVLLLGEGLVLPGELFFASNSLTVPRLGVLDLLVSFGLSLNADGLSSRELGEVVVEVLL